MLMDTLYLHLGVQVNLYQKPFPDCLYLHLSQKSYKTFHFLFSYLHSWYIIFRNMCKEITLYDERKEGKR